MSIIAPRKLQVITDGSGDPGANHDAPAGYVAHQLYVNTDDNSVWLCIDPADGAAVWKELTAIDALTGAQTVSGNWTFTGSVIRASQTRQIGTRAKVGAGAGWTVGAANNLPYIGTVAASQSAATLVIPIDGLKIGDTITGFRVVAQVESAGGAVTIDADLRATTNVAAEPTDASIGTMTQVSVTADTAVSQAKTGLTEVVASGKTYYLLVTVTTAGSTDVILQACEITVTES